MCRFTFYQGPELSLGSLLTEPTHSLINQSYNALEREEPLNGDGFGVAWYDQSSPEPARFRSISPAWNNANLLELARVVRSRCVLAHVRAATQALGVSEANCHPFKQGPLAFMHNGDIEGFAGIRRALLEGLSDSSFDLVRGATDSEHFFALLLDALAAVPKAADASAGERMAAAFSTALTRVRALLAETPGDHHIYLNAVLCDGVNAVICRYTTDSDEHADSLYLNQGRRYVCEDGVCHMVTPNEQLDTLVVASEPLSDDPGWQPIAVNSLVLVRNGRVLGHRSLAS